MRLGLLLASLVLTVTGAQSAAAQVFIDTTTAPKRDFVADASQMPPQQALTCYSLFAVAMDKGEVKGADEPETVRRMMNAYQARVDGEIKRVGAPGDIKSMSEKIRTKMAGDWNFGEYLTMRDQCSLATSAGLVKFRATPGGQDAINCWGYLANKAPNDPDRAFLEHDIRAAFLATRVDYSTETTFFHVFKRDGEKLFAGPNAAQLDARFTGCAPKARPAIRAIAYATAPDSVQVTGGVLGAIRFDLFNAPGASPYGTARETMYWPLPATAWKAWVASPEAGNASICMRERPLRDKSAPANSVTALDIGVKTLTDAGAKPAEALAALTRGATDLRGSSTMLGVYAACQVWGDAAAKRMGKNWFAGEAYNGD